jgi:hypothetical protein
VTTETTGQTLPCTATDHSNNAAAQTVNIKLDLAAPSLTCPANVTVNQGQTVVLGSPNNVSDSIGLAPAITNNAPATFPGGITAVTWTATDAAGHSASCAQVVKVNRAPVAAADALTLVHSGASPMIVPAPGVLGNDSDADGDAFSVVGATAVTPRIISLGTAGSLSLFADGHFIYTPTATFSGSRSFTYQVTDGPATSAAATVTLTIQNNTAPMARNDTATTALNQPVTINVLANHTDAQSNIDPTTVTLVAAPANGGVVVNGNGTVVYAPASNFVGTDQFTYTVRDTLGALSGVATVTVYVPAAINDSYTATAGTAASQTVNVAAANGVRTNDIPNVTGRTFSVVSTPIRISGTGAGTLTLSTFTTSNGAFSYTLAGVGATGAVRQASKRGVFQFTYTMTLNGVTTGPATVTITVN